MIRIAIIRFPGTNCDRDTLHVIKNILKINTELVWHTDNNIDKYDVAILPGGFSYGDNLRAGIIAAHSPALKIIKDMANKGKPILGICNGFQILVESGLLPGSLLYNSSLKFVCKWINVKVNNCKTSFTSDCKKSSILRMPIAHAEGRYFIDNKGLKELKRNNQIVFTYVNEQGIKNEESNPNGSLENIAGISNIEGNVVGLMPHPERSSEKILSPYNNDDGIKIIQSVVNNLKG